MAEVMRFLLMDATRLDVTRFHKKGTEELQEESRPYHFGSRLWFQPLLLTLCAVINK
jgi:hypothetical protein